MRSMHTYDTFWSVIAQSVLILGFALVAEVRLAVRKWEYDARRKRLLSALYYFVTGVILLAVFNVSLSALSGAEIAHWIRIVVINVLASVAVLLIANPIVVNGTAGNMDLIWMAYNAKPLITKRYRRMRLKWSRRRARGVRKDAYRFLLHIRSIRRAMDALESGEVLSPSEWVSVVASLSRRSGINRRAAKQLVGEWAEVSEGDRRAALAQIADLEDRGKGVLLNQGEVVRRMSRTLERGVTKEDLDREAILRAVWDRSAKDLL